MSNIIDKIRLSGTDYTLSATTSGVSVVEVTQAEYDALPSSAKTDTSKMYVITDAEAGDLTNYYTKTETDNAITAATATKQDTLVSGTNIKTINNESILGSGNIDIQGGGGKAIEAGRGISVASGDSAYTVSFNLPISAGTGTNSLVIASDNYNLSNRATKSGAVALNGAGIHPTYATGSNSLAEGADTKAAGWASHAEGYCTTAMTDYSHSEGEEVKATNVAEHSQGRYNASNKANNTWGDSGNTLFSVGNGTADNARHNAFEIRQNGDIYLSSGGTDIKLQDHLGGGGGGGTVESAITSGSTNAVESKAIWSATTYNKDVLITFNGNNSTNYPNGCTKIKVEDITIDSQNYINFNDDRGYDIAHIIVSNRGSISVDTSYFQGASYEISGSTVIISYPTITNVHSLSIPNNTKYTYKAVVEGAWIADNTYMKEEVDAIQNTLQSNINQKLDSTAYTPVNVDSALIENSTNPVEGGVLYDELVYKGAASETTIEWSGNESTNYPSGCTEIKVEVSGSNNSMYLNFINDEWQQFGNVNITNWGSISVDASNFQAASYEISGSTVTISYPSVTGVTKINSSGAVTYTTKAVTYGASTTVKDALGGLKFVKLTQTEYDNLQTKDSNTLYVIVN